MSKSYKDFIRQFDRDKFKTQGQYTLKNRAKKWYRWHDYEVKTGAGVGAILTGGGVS